jgi:hypothetical protein
MGNPSSLRLGELLVKNQIITEVQLAQAVRAQHIFGGRLGTNLVELGFISEQLLTKFLSTQLTIPAVPIAALDNVPESVLRLVPRAVAEKYEVVPISVSGHKLRVAMSDPTDLAGIDEVSFATGYHIQPVIAPELLVIYSLEKHYGIARGLRYIRFREEHSVADQLEGPAAANHLLPLDAPSKAPAPAELPPFEMPAPLQAPLVEFPTPAQPSPLEVLRQGRKNLLSVEITAFAAKVMKLGAEGKVPQEVVEGVSNLIAKVDKLQLELNGLKARKRS